MPLETDFQFVGAKKPKRLPIVLSLDEVQAVLDRMDGTTKIIGQLLYGSGLPVGGDLEYADQNTLLRALAGRQEMGE